MKDGLGKAGASRNEGVEPEQSMNETHSESARTFRAGPLLSRRWETVARKSGFACSTAGEAREWKAELVRKLRELIGYDRMAPAELRPRITEEVEFEDFLRERVEIQTEPGLVMPVYVLRPKDGVSGPRPAVIAPHGHHGGGKLSIAGGCEIPEVVRAMEAYNYGYGLEFARAGFVTFCPDARGFGERREFPEAGGDPLNGSCEWLNHMALPLGQTVTGMWVWDLHRLVDYIQARGDCSADRIGCAGLSGGGLQTLWASALDERIRCAVVSGYFYGFREALLEQPENCSCNYVPHLFEHVDAGDLGALLAPRPFLVETGAEDSLNGRSGLANVRSQTQIARAAYRLFNAEDLFAHDVCEGGHRWYGRSAIPWMRKHLAEPER